MTGAATPELPPLLAANPRLDQWADHFQLSGTLLSGRTAVGRVTVIVLNMNHPCSLAVRGALLDQGMRLE